MAGRAEFLEERRGLLDGMVFSGGVAHEIQTTVHSALLGPPELANLAADLAAFGISDHKIQPFRAAGVKIRASPRLRIKWDSGEKGWVPC